MPEAAVETPAIPAAPVVEQKPAEPAVDTKALQDEIDRLKAENSEKDTATRYWYEEAKKGVKPAPAKAEPPPEAEEDLLELIAKKGSKGLDEVLEKRGYVRGDQVDSRINERAQIISAENELGAKYPDLKDNKSEFFKATAVHYADLVKQGTPQPVAMRQAANLASLDVSLAKLKDYESGKRMPAEEKEEREARARAQGGDKGRKAAEKELENDELDDFQKKMCEVMEVDQDAYKKRAKAGVIVGGAK